MAPASSDSRDRSPPQAVRWLRLARLLLSVVALAIGVWKAVAGTL